MDTELSIIRNERIQIREDTQSCSLFNNAILLAFMIDSYELF